MENSNNDVIQPKKIILTHFLSPGDVVMLTAAIRDLHHTYPGQFLTDIRSSCNAIWENNPYLTPLDENDPDVKVIPCDYPLIHRSNTSPYHFIHGFRMFLEEKLNIQIESKIFKGDIYISDQEKLWISQTEEMGIKDDFWIIMAGGKYDYTCKWYSPEFYQTIVTHFKKKITFVQCGSTEHWHPPLKGVVNLIGKTDLRQFIRLVYHSVGVLCPVTLAMHLAAAVPVKENRPQNRACVVIAGGREPTQWEAYPHHRFLSNNGALNCCDNGGCWASRCQKVNDGDEKDKNNLCLYPVRIKENLFIPKCMHIIKPRMIIDAIEMYYSGGALSYNKKSMNKGQNH